VVDHLGNGELGFLKQPTGSGTMTTRGTGTALSYRNRLGGTFYLHEGKTKTGKPRYFAAKTVGEAALAAMPAGYEFSESINGVVSVRRVDAKASKVPEGDLAIARAELARHPRLALHRVEEVKGEIVVFQPLHGRYDPVMKFVPSEVDQPGKYAVHRMTYRGKGGWSWPLEFGTLERLVKKFIRHVGTEGFFELL